MSDRFCLLFDLDGTLVDSAVGIAAAVNELVRQRGGNAISISRVRELVSYGAPALLQEALGEFASGSTADLAAFRTILTGIPADLAWIYPGVRENLEQFAADGHALAVVTNKPQSLGESLLQDLGLIQYFEVIVGGDTLANCKPHPEPLLHALTAVGGSTDFAMMIGDSDVDAAAAASAEVSFVLFEGGYGPSNCLGEAWVQRFGDHALLPDMVDAATQQQSAAGTNGARQLIN